MDENDRERLFTALDQIVNLLERTIAVAEDFHARLEEEEAQRAVARMAERYTGRR